MQQLMLQIVQLKELSAEAGDTFVSTTRDPQVYLAPAAGRFTDLAVDNAVFRARLFAEGSALHRPVLYLDFGGGFADEADRRLRLRPDAAGWVEVEIPSPWRLRSIRLDPSERPCRFILDSTSLSPAPSSRPQKPTGGLIGAVRAVYRAVPLPLGLKRSVARYIVSASIQRRLTLSDGGLRRPLERPAPAAAYRGAYQAALHTQLGWRSPDFGAARLTAVDSTKAAVKVLAFYLPQFHPFAENDLWWGKGFTEWTNVSKAAPQFVGHEQPKLPADLGYYDLRLTETLRDQAELARRHGLTGFCFHFYWFGGKRLMETPLQDWLASDIDFPFALCWANENWTRRWDGAEDELLIGQAHSPSDDIAFLTYVARYLTDPRYLRVDGKPVLVVYRPSLFDDALATTRRWREAAKALGLPGLHLVASNAFGLDNHRELGFDAMVEFPPHGIDADDTTGSHTLLNSDYRGAIYRYKSVVESALDEIDDPVDRSQIIYPGVFPGWDNTARRKAAGNVFHGSTPTLFRRWLGAAGARAANLPSGQRFVFVNAWNEWAEGAYLEPDRRFGHAHLCAVADFVEEHQERDTHLVALAHSSQLAFVPCSSTLVVAHIYYPELIDELAAALSPLGTTDIVLTAADTLAPATLGLLRAHFPHAALILTKNRGRDVLPFLEALRFVQSLSHRWETGLKIHTKRSPHITGGDAWREALYRSLAGDNGRMRERLLNSPRLGLLAPVGSLRPLEGDAMVNNKNRVEVVLKKMGGAVSAADRFPAGSMFWFRPAAMAPLQQLNLNPEDFEPELGQIDGSTAHAVERLFGISARLAGFEIAEA
jgi:lipopolysaccharide biosynthesis protein